MIQRQPRSPAMPSMWPMLQVGGLLLVAGCTND
jgi:hypothetical protein